MKHAIDAAVTDAQDISNDCLVCGADNPYGLHAHFYDMDNGECVGVFDLRPQHQSYPGRVHGGIITAILDETIARAATSARGELTYSVTTRISVRFSKPVPYDRPIVCVARVDRDRHRMYTGSGEIIDEAGGVLASATGEYAVFTKEQIGGAYFAEQDMFPDPKPHPSRITFGQSTE